jgi:hypothetical protein
VLLFSDRLHRFSLQRFTVVSHGWYVTTGCVSIRYGGLNRVGDVGGRRITTRMRDGCLWLTIYIYVREIR